MKCARGEHVTYTLRKKEHHPRFCRDALALTKSIKRVTRVTLTLSRRKEREKKKRKKNGVVDIRSKNGRGLFWNQLFSRAQLCSRMLLTNTFIAVSSALPFMTQVELIALYKLRDNGHELYQTFHNRYRESIDHSRAWFNFVFNLAISFHAYATKARTKSVWKV